MAGPHVTVAVLWSAVFLFPSAVPAAAPAVHDPAWSPVADQVLFYGDAGGDFDVYLFDLHTGVARPVIGGPGYEGNPAWAPDGTRISFASDRDGDFEIFTAEPDGSDPRRVTDNDYRDLAHGWSPDGLRIAFESRRDGNSDIYVIDVDSGRETRLTTHEGNDFRPSWCPASGLIVFQSNRAGSYQIYSVEPDGSGLRQISSVAGNLVNPACGPATDRIVASHVEDRDRATIVVLADDGSVESRLTGGDEVALAPSWSGDEKRVVFYAVRGGESALYAMDGDGSGRRRVAIEKGSEDSDEGAPSPALRPLRDVAYVPDPHPEQRLDFYWPPGAPATVLFVHGGSLKESGERRSSPEYQDICPTFAAAGVGCATVDYRLFPSFSWPAMVEDVAAAVAKVRGLVEEQGGDPGRLVLFGHSSGCQLAAVLGANPVYLGGVGLEPGNLAGVVAMGCVLDNYDAALRDLTAERIAAAFAENPDERARWGSAEGWIAANPSYHLGAHMPPTLVLVAEGERFFPPLLEQGARFVRRLLELDVPADLVVVRGTHRTSIEGVGDAGDPVFEVVRSFVLDPSGVGGE